MESTTPCERLVLVVDLSVLVVDLHFMEALITHALGVHDEATLGERCLIILVIHHANIV